MSEVTDLIGLARAGDPGARGELFSATYAELRKLARFRLRDGGRSAVMDTTALVHDAYLRFLAAGELRQGDRRAFFSYASQIMRSVVVDAVRGRRAQRRGGDLDEVTLDTQALDGLAGGEQELLRVHEALAALEQAEPRLGKVVEMRYFGGYSEQEIARALDVTDRTVRRDWERARLILVAMLAS